jgi:hypothetical protein
MCKTDWKRRRHVASFCATSLAAESCFARRIEVGTDLARCQHLQQETREAMAAACPFAGIADIRPSLEAIREAARGGSTVALHPLQLATIADTAIAALKLRAAVLQQGEPVGGEPEAGSERLDSSNGASTRTGTQGAHAAVASAGNGSSGKRFPALAEHAGRISPWLQGLVDVISKAIDLKSGAIRDDASEALANARLERKANAHKLAAEIAYWCQELYKKGASTVRTAALRRGRQCCSVKRGQSGVRPCATH